MTQAFYLDDAKAAVLLVGDDKSHTMVWLATAGDPATGPEGFGIPTPGTAEQLEAYLTPLRVPPAPPTPAEKLAALGLTVEELQDLLTK